MHGLTITFITLTLLIGGCTTQQLEEQILGKQRALPEPKSNYATVTFEAPTLTKVLWTHDKVKVKLFNSCSDSWWDDQGYIGGITLSTKPEIGNKKKIKVPAGNTLLLEIGHRGQFQCTGKYRWTPQQGIHYKFTYNLDGYKCYTSGIEIRPDGKTTEIESLEKLANKDGFFSASGSTIETWRKCSKIDNHKIN